MESRRGLFISFGGSPVVTPVTSRRRHTRFLNVTGVQTCALPIDRKSTRLNPSHIQKSRMPSSARKKNKDAADKLAKLAIGKGDDILILIQTVNVEIFIEIGRQFKKFVIFLLLL